MKNKIASYISVIGHPLLTIPLFAIIALFTYEEFKKALIASLILAGIFIPISLKMYLGSKSGTYTNFDVSDRTQRQGWYIFAIVVLIIVTIILFITDQSRTLRISVLLSLILLIVSRLVNYFIKSSLHISFNVFLSFLILPMNFVAGLLFLVFTVLIAWARLFLQRHSVKEIITGAVIGFSIGVLSLLSF